MSATVLAELRGGRLDRGLDGADVAREAGLSAAQYSRIERGLTRSVSIEQASILLGVVGLELRVAVYPAGEPLRDAAHVALIGRFKAVVHPTLRILTGSRSRDRLIDELGTRS